MTSFVTITGATGNVGMALAQRLLQNRVKVRAVARRAEKLAPLAASGAEACAGDLQNTGFLTEAFRGADAVFAMIPSHADALDFRADQRRTAASLAEALKTASVPRVVVLSSVGAYLPSGTGPLATLHEFEEMLKSISGLSVIVLRAAYFMENHLAAIPLIKHAGVYGGPFRADLAHPMIATRDIAAVAAELLCQPTFEGYTVRELLGPSDYTFCEVASILGAAIGKPDLDFVEASYEDFHQGLLGAGCSASFADSIVEMYRVFNEGRLQSRMGRNASTTTPTTLKEFAREVFAPAYHAS
jgi:uncharacterized protein YbjT (DUF2867 family)